MLMRARVPNLGLFCYIFRMSEEAAAVVEDL